MPERTLLSESQVLRRLDVNYHLAGKLRTAGVLIPDEILSGRVRMYRADRLDELAAQITALQACSSTQK